VCASCAWELRVLDCEILMSTSSIDRFYGFHLGQLPLSHTFGYFARSPVPRLLAPLTHLFYSLIFLVREKLIFHRFEVDSWMVFVEQVLQGAQEKALARKLLLQSKHSQNPIISLHLSWKSLTLKRCSRPRSLQRSQRSQRSQLYGTELSGFVRQFTRHYQYSRVHSTWNWEGNQPMT